MSKLRSEQCSCISPLSPAFDFLDRQRLYMKGYGGGLRGHVSFLWVLPPHQWPLTLTSLPTRYNDISCRTFFSIFNHFEMNKLFLALLSPRLILSPLNCDVKSLQIKKMVYSKSHCGDTSTPWNNYMLTRIDGIRRGSIHYSLLSSFSFSAFQFFDWHSFIQ